MTGHTGLRLDGLYSPEIYSFVCLPGARSVFTPTQLQSQDAAELAKLICSNATADAAIAEAYRLFSAAGGLARVAALAYKQADCNKQLAVVVDGVNEGKLLHLCSGTVGFAMSNVKAAICCTLLAVIWNRPCFRVLLERYSDTE